MILKRLLAFVIAFCAMFGFWLLMAAFANWQTNPAKWSPLTRETLAVLGGMISLIFGLAIAANLELITKK
jgi:hypothetical protein